MSITLSPQGHFRMPIASFDGKTVKPLGSGDKHHTDDETARPSARPKGGRG